MGLGIHIEHEVYVVLSIPLEWESNSIIANHLRMLADEIEKEDINIQSFNLSCPINEPYGKPRLECKGFKNSKTIPD